MNNNKQKIERIKINPYNSPLGFIKSLKLVQSDFAKFGFNFEFDLYQTGTDGYDKYRDYTREQLIRTIKLKNKTISRLNGKIYHLTHKVERYKNKINKKDGENENLVTKAKRNEGLLDIFDKEDYTPRTLKEKSLIKILSDNEKGLDTVAKYLNTKSYEYSVEITLTRKKLK